MFEIVVYYFDQRPGLSAPASGTSRADMPFLLQPGIPPQAGLIKDRKLMVYAKARLCLPAGRQVRSAGTVTASEARQS